MELLKSRSDTMLSHEKTIFSLKKNLEIDTKIIIKKSDFGTLTDQFVWGQNSISIWRLLFECLFPCFIAEIRMNHNRWFVRIGKIISISIDN